MLRGFLAGLGIGAPLYGWTVDTTGSYTLMWWISLTAFVLAVLPLGPGRAVRRGLADG